MNATDTLSLVLALGGLSGSAVRVLLTSSQPVVSKKSATELVIGAMAGFLWPLYPLIPFPEHATMLQQAAIVAGVAYLSGDFLLNAFTKATAALKSLTATAK